MPSSPASAFSVSLPSFLSLSSGKSSKSKFNFDQKRTAREKDCSKSRSKRQPPVVPERDSSLYRTKSAVVVIGRQGGSESGQATASFASSCSPPSFPTTTYSLQDYHFPKPPNRYSLFSQSAYNLDKPPSLTSSSASIATSTYHSTIDLSRPPSLSFVESEVFASHASSPSFWNDDQDDFVLEPFDFDIRYIRSGDFRSKAKFTSQSVVRFDDFNISDLRTRSQGMQSEIWSKSTSDDMTGPPPVPARSRLRTVPTPKMGSVAPSPVASPVPGTSPRAITRQSSLFQLPVDLPASPSQIPLPVSASPSSASRFNSPDLSQYPAATRESFGAFSRKKSGKLDKDPYKVKDGVEKKSSSSGVYTPTTFPGASGPRPSHFPSHVYTPSGFSLHPQHIQSAHPISPSGSSTHSSSSSQSEFTAPPQTPLSPTNRFSKTLTNIRRISNNVVHHKDKKGQERDSYFIPPSSSYEFQVSDSHSRQSSWGPQTPHLRSSTQDSHTPMHSPTGSYFPPVSAGLGVGLPAERDAAQIRRARALSTGATTVYESEVGFDFGSPKTQAQSQGVKGRRKPVPKVAEDSLVKEMGALEVQQVHAL